MDSAVISAAISGSVVAGSNILGLLKNVAESTKSLGKAEIVNQLLEVQVAMMELLQKQQQLIEENHELRNKISKLTEDLNLKHKMEYHYDSYWIRKKDESLDGPFSKIQWENSGKLARLVFHSKGKYSSSECCQFRDYKADEFANIPYEFIKDNKVNPEIYREK